MIYVIGISGRSDVVKIGTSQNSLTRMKSLQSAIPDELVLLAESTGSYWQESAIKNHFSIYNIRGEWFRRSEEIDFFIKNIEVETVRIFLCNGVSKNNAYISDTIPIPKNSHLSKEPEIYNSNSKIDLEMGRQIKEARTVLQLSLERLGNLVGVSGATIKNWEAGHQPSELAMPRYKMALKAAERRRAANNGKSA